MARLPPRRFDFREMERRPDNLEGGLRGGSPPRFPEGPRWPRREAQGVGRGGGVSPPSPTLLQRDLNLITRHLPVDSTNVASVKDRRRAHGLLVAVQKGKLETARASSAISVALTKKNAASRQRALKAQAKPLGADRRVWNFTPGPKTYYGTFASIVPRSGGRFRFVLPQHVVPCVQRQTRREVLFAFRKTGKHSSRKSKRFGPHSMIGCN